MATQTEILDEMRTAISAVATTRDAAVLFLAVDTQQPFDKQQVEFLGGVECFTLEAGPWVYTQRWGEEGAFERDATFHVKLHHPVVEGRSNEAREADSAEDCAHIAEVLETRTWAADGVEGVWYLGGVEVDRSNPEDWVTTMPFRVVYRGARRTS